MAITESEGRLTDPTNLLRIALLEIQRVDDTTVSPMRPLGEKSAAKPPPSALPRMVTEAEPVAGVFRNMMELGVGLLAERERVIEAKCGTCCPPATSDRHRPRPTADLDVELDLKRVEEEDAHRVDSCAVSPADLNREVATVIAALPAEADKMVTEVAPVTGTLEGVRELNMGRS